MKNEELESDTTNSNNSSQEQKGKTIRLTSFPQIYLKRWLSYQSQKNNNISNQSQESDSPIQDVEEGQTESTALHEAPIQIDPVQPLPTTLAQPASKTSKQASINSNLLWPIILILSAIAAGLANFAFPHMALRPFIVFWFLFICPGMALVRFLRLKEPVVELTLAVALSFAVDAILASIQLYTGKWSPAGTLGILMLLCLFGAIVQLLTIYPITNLHWKNVLSQPHTVFRSVGVVLNLYLVNPLSAGLSKIVGNRKTAPPIPKLPRTIYVGNFRILVLILLTLLLGVIIGVSFWSFKGFFGPHSGTLPSERPLKATPNLSHISTVVHTPSASSTHIAELYNGTIYDISANVTTKMSLTGIQQTQLTFDGNFTGLHKIGTFNGSIDPHPPKHIQFTVKDSAGHVILSFEGYIQSDGELSGSYCNLDQDARCTGNYGIWSVTPS